MGRAPDPDLGESDQGPGAAMRLAEPEQQDVVCSGSRGGGGREEIGQGLAFPESMLGSH